MGFYTNTFFSKVGAFCTSSHFSVPKILSSPPMREGGDMRRHPYFEGVIIMRHQLHVTCSTAALSIVLLQPAAVLYDLCSIKVALFMTSDIFTYSYRHDTVNTHKYSHTLYPYKVFFLSLSVEPLCNTNGEDICLIAHLIILTNTSNKYKRKPRLHLFYQSQKCKEYTCVFLAHSSFSKPPLFSRCIFRNEKSFK